MAKMYHENAADIALIRGKKVGIVGYGSQGHAHALNLKDSGVDVRVGLPADQRIARKSESQRTDRRRRSRKSPPGPTSS